jgi:hypothetical protein
MSAPLPILRESWEPEPPWNCRDPRCPCHHSMICECGRCSSTYRTLRYPLEAREAVFAEALSVLEAAARVMPRELAEAILRKGLSRVQQRHPRTADA